MIADLPTVLETAATKHKDLKNCIAIYMMSNQEKHTGANTLRFFFSNPEIICGNFD